MLNVPGFGKTRMVPVTEALIATATSVFGTVAFALGTAGFALASPPPISHPRKSRPTRCSPSITTWISSPWRIRGVPRNGQHPLELHADAALSDEVVRGVGGKGAAGHGLRGG